MSDTHDELGDLNNRDGFIPFKAPSRKRDSKSLEEDSISSDLKPAKKPVFLNNIVVPWLEKPVVSNFNLTSKAPPMVRFHNEILQFCEFVTPRKEELTSRNSIIKQLANLCQSIWPESRVEVFGSQLTKMLTPSSDIDIALLDVPIESGQDTADILALLAGRIRAVIPVTYLEVIITARVPIIKYDHKETGLSVDICINNDQGLKTGNMIQDFLKAYPVLLPMTLVLKTFLVK